MAQDYMLTGRSWGWAAVAGLWTIACDVTLKALSRAAGCETPSVAAGFRESWQVPEGCEALPLAGDSLAVQAHAHTGTLFGIARDGLDPAMGQVVALGLLALAAVATVVVLRWKRRASGDPSALALLWAGAIASAGPRLLGSQALSELHIAGIPTSVAEIAFAFGAFWLAARVVGELVSS